jgi:hypothetical protein
LRVAVAELDVGAGRTGTLFSVLPLVVREVLEDVDMVDAVPAGRLAAAAVVDVVPGRRPAGVGVVLPFLTGEGLSLATLGLDLVSDLASSAPDSTVESTSVVISGGGTLTPSGTAGIGSSLEAMSFAQVVV